MLILQNLLTFGFLYSLLSAPLIFGAVSDESYWIYMVCNLRTLKSCIEPLFSCHFANP